MLGARMLARSQVTLCAQEGGDDEDVTVFHWGSPERLDRILELSWDGEERERTL